MKMLTMVIVMMVIQGAQSRLTLCNCSPPGSYVCGIPRQEYWSELPFPPSGDLPNPGIKPRSTYIAGRSLPSEPSVKPKAETQASEASVLTPDLPPTSCVILENLISWASIFSSLKMNNSNFKGMYVRTKQVTYVSSNRDIVNRIYIRKTNSHNYSMTQCFLTT